MTVSGRSGGEPFETDTPFGWGYDGIFPGACCLGDGSCALALEPWECPVLLGGIFQGAGSICPLVNCACPLDMDGDGAVSTPELLAILASWGSWSEGPPDLDGDFVVGMADLAILLDGWGPCS